MPTMQEIRAKFPQYAEMTDGDLLMGIQQKYYKDTNPSALFKSIEGAEGAHVTIKNPKFKKIWFEMAKQPFAGETPEQTEKRLYGGSTKDFIDTPSRGEAYLRSGFQGATIGYGDEIVGKGVELASKHTPAPIKKALGLPEQVIPYERAVEMEKAKLAKGEEAYPLGTTLSEMGGGTLLPLGTAKTTTGGVIAGTALGSAYASGKAEGGLGERLKAAAVNAPASALFSVAMVPIQRGVTAGMKKLLGFDAKKPSVRAAKQFKKMSYKAVDDAGITFGADDYDNMLTRVYQELDDPIRGPVKGDTHVEKAAEYLEKNWGDDISLTKVDTLRSNLWKRWLSAPSDQQGPILGMIGKIDDLIDSKNATPLMKTAREADKTFRRLEMLDDMLKVAANKMEASGTGQPYTKYAQVFEKIVDTPRLRRQFTEEQIDFFQKALKSTPKEKALQKLGKLDPTSGGLMAALNIIGGAIDPKLMAMGGVGFAANKMAGSKANAKNLAAQLMLTGQLPPAPTRTPLGPLLGGEIGLLNMIEGQ